MAVVKAWICPLLRRLALSGLVAVFLGVVAQAAQAVPEVVVLPTYFGVSQQKKGQEAETKQGFGTTDDLVLFGFHQQLAQKLSDSKECAVYDVRSLGFSEQELATSKIEELAQRCLQEKGAAAVIWGNLAKPVSVKADEPNPTDAFMRFRSIRVKAWVAIHIRTRTGKWDAPFSGDARGKIAQKTIFNNRLVYETGAINEAIGKALTAGTAGALEQLKTIATGATAAKAEEAALESKGMDPIQVGVRYFAVDPGLRNRVPTLERFALQDFYNGVLEDVIQNDPKGVEQVTASDDLLKQAEQQAALRRELGIKEGAAAQLNYVIYGEICGMSVDTTGDDSHKVVVEVQLRAMNARDTSRPPMLVMGKAEVEGEGWIDANKGVSLQMETLRIVTVNAVKNAWGTLYPKLQ